jgi:hypothetical protein
MKIQFTRLIDLFSRYKNILAIVLCVPIFLHMVWPLKNKILLTSTFAESRISHFHDGLDIISNTRAIYPVDSGDILFYRFSNDHPYSQILGPGNFIVVEHENQITTSYYHMDSKSPIFESAKISEDTLIGWASDSGHSAGEHLHFTAMKKDGRTFVNLLKNLPILEDKNPPIIEAIFLYQDKKNEIIHLAEGDKITVSKNYPILVSIRDPGRNKNTRRGIYKIRASHNGQKLLDYTFDEIRFEKNQWKLNGQYPIRDIYFKKYYYINGLELSQGANKIFIECEDLAGNKNSRSFLFHIEKI